ncbi:16S rRNA (adenine(1518)-N(6)/adenine(1519)-N(6))-dimethyltransferase RsmA [Candidatus Berkiella aquae]|uniref:Ribosomal RNA small subunit methyltransferase A n=1 Tax=Candidatus Berkiella aquae TaxID=295108 RepID=A0A0Q9YJT7_9GAMM|nr:16S rRNA (adenine(1518)-N(6)/adenine(1519)-N(6))-dimethyltransferase RsmA [Candidatus Berkiella aquae]MCS5710111.1 16S rRNA (adenine(1518)-N(6)/adenine(1519)-N(6))-dimethyltransferase RsmA [Candidatus Berkiella aquae]
MTESHQPRKRFGQHFLVDNHAIKKIIHALHPQQMDNLVEIGAGTGALTNHIVEQVEHLHIVEIDNDLVIRLKGMYPPSKVSIHHQDALTFDFGDLFHPNAPLRVFGNLPYNISTPLLFHLLQYATKIHDMLFMLQKEVIVRMCAKPGTSDYGRLSIMIQYACQTQMLFDIPPQAFAPPPKVMSSLIILKPYGDKRPHPLANHYETFAHIVNVAFQHRRKTLKNALQTCVSAEVFEKVGIDAIRRPETLSVSEYVMLSNAIERPFLDT